MQVPAKDLGYITPPLIEWVEYYSPVQKKSTMPTATQLSDMRAGGKSVVQ